MEQIFLSPEFQKYKPFFVIFILILLVLAMFLFLRIVEIYLRIVEVRNETKGRKLLEKLFNETEGENIMEPLDGKTMFEQVRKGVLPTDASGNQAKQVQGLTQIMQGLSKQSTGMVQRMRQLTLMEAGSVEMASGAQIIESVDSHIQTAQGQFDKETPHQVAEALGNEVHPGPNSLDAPVAEPQADASGETQVKPVSEASVDTPVEILSAISAETVPEVNQGTEETFVKDLIASPELRAHFAQSFLGLGGGAKIDNGYSFSKIPKGLFDIIWAHFNGMKSNGTDYKRAFDFLQQVKSERNEA